MNKTSKIFIAGHNGMVGSSIYRKLITEGYNNIVTKSSKELDLRNQIEVNNFFSSEKPEFVFLSAAKVGGIYANNVYRAEFIYNNIMIESNVIYASHVNNVKKLLFLGSSCIYPKLAPQPLKEEYLLSNYLEETNQPYAIAKIAGIELCNSFNYQYGCNFISVLPTNLYGTNDNYHLENSHVLPALLRKIIHAKNNNLDLVEIWGTGKPKREFLHVDDLSDACLYIMNNNFDDKVLNVGTGLEISIFELAKLISKLVKYDGEFIFNESFPDGTPRKLLDVSKLTKLGWRPKISLEQGLKKTIKEVQFQF